MKREYDLKRNVSVIRWIHVYVSIMIRRVELHKFMIVLEDQCLISSKSYS